MSFIHKLKSRMTELRQAAAEKISELLPMVDSETKEQRLAICEPCEFLFKATRQCKKCGCFVDFKTDLASASCPINKWKIVDITELKNVHTGQE